MTLVAFDIYEIAEVVKYAVTAKGYTELSLKAQSINPARSHCLSSLEFVVNDAASLDDELSDILGLINMHGSTRIPLHLATQSSYVIQTSGDSQLVKDFVATIKPTVIENLSELRKLIDTKSPFWKTIYDTSFHLGIPIGRSNSLLHLAFTSPKSLIEPDKMLLSDIICENCGQIHWQSASTSDYVVYSEDEEYAREESYRIRGPKSGLINKQALYLLTYNLRSRRHLQLRSETVTRLW